MKHLSINNLLEIRNTGKYGNGVYARVDISKGTPVFTMGGKRVTVKEIVARVNAGKEEIDDPLQIGKKTYIDLNEKSRSFNHSCDPNVGMRKNSELFALRDIAKDEEVRFDYSTTIAPTSWRMTCKCGAKNCRKVLGDIRSIPKKQLEHYLHAGALQRYMKPIVQQLAAGTYVIPKYEQEALDTLTVTHTT